MVFFNILLILISLIILINLIKDTDFNSLNVFGIVMCLFTIIFAVVIIYLKS